MIATMDFDIIDIVTPSHTHREIALAAMARGRHVLLEKPMAISLEDCKAIVAAQRRHGVRLAVGHEFRLSSQWGEIKRIIERGTIGEPQYVLVELLRKPYRQGAGRLALRSEPRRQLGAGGADSLFRSRALVSRRQRRSRSSSTPTATRAIRSAPRCSTISARCSNTRTAATPSCRKRSPPSSIIRR
jgi:hypothetical protein